METDLRVTEHHAKDRKEKYIVVLEGNNSDGNEVKMVLTSQDDEILRMYPRESEFSLMLIKSKQKKLDGEE